MPICHACSSHFPNHVRLNGRSRNLQRRKFCLECSPFGAHNTKNLVAPAPVPEPVTRRCPRCARVRPADDFYRRRSGAGRVKYCKDCSRAQTVERQQALKRRAVEYKGGKCARCGYDRYLGSLDFHHTDPGAKDFNLAAAHCTSFEKIKPELDKCVLLCANCHREEHARLKGLLQGK